MNYSLTFSLAILLIFCTSLKSQKSISGTVTDTEGLPLIGATIQVKNSQIGCISDIDGSFTIEADSSDVLIVTYIGYIAQEVSLGSNDLILVQLEPSSLILEEVVVSGYKRIGIRSMLAARVSGISTSTDSESYAHQPENRFRKVSMNPLSTFSVDVDVASYTNVRRHLNNGELPPPDAVRTEEMLNYFQYDYEEASGELPFSINTELAACPWNEENLLLHVGLQGRKIPLEELPPSNIVFLIDVSGSMSDHNKLPLLKSSLSLLVEQLREEDRVSMVVYAGSSGLVLDSAHGNEKDLIREALEQLEAGGGTAGSEGLELAYEVAVKNFMQDGNNRIVLATDGDFNIGPHSDGAMKRMIKEHRQKGVAISVLGFGMGNYKDSKMEAIADRGNGNYAYIDNLLEARKVLVSEFGGTFHTIAKDVKLQLEFNPRVVSKYRLIGYENRLLENEDFEDDTKDAGDIGAGHTVTALYEIIPRNNKRKEKKLKYQDVKPSQHNDLLTVGIRYKQAEGRKSFLEEKVVENLPLIAENTSENFKFSAAIVQFGMLLRESEFLGKTDWENTIALAKEGRGLDQAGYRAEMIRLLEMVKDMD